MTASALFECSFCGKPQDEVKNLIAGPACYICNECVDLCHDIISPEPEETFEPLAAGEVMSMKDLEQRRWVVLEQFATRMLPLIKGIGGAGLVYTQGDAKTERITVSVRLQPATVPSEQLH